MKGCYDWWNAVIFSGGYQRFTCVAWGCGEAGLGAGGRIHLDMQFCIGISDLQSLRFVIVGTDMVRVCGIGYYVKYVDVPVAVQENDVGR